MKDIKDKKTLLIVDEDNVNLMTLSNILQSEYNVHAASNGISAIKNRLQIPYQAFLAELQGKLEQTPVV
ncbi:MAG: hypothetical protein LBI42_06090 [Chitinispirillales bacterium]|jgi:PleD family two-component response regulator|nr:hypothetical protein [Chitinispirillales bacterium]